MTRQREVAIQMLNKPQRGRMVMAEVGRTQGAGQQRSAVAPDVPIPTPPFWGARIERDINHDDLFDCLDRNALYRLQWGAKNAKGDEWERLKAEFDQRVAALREEAEREGWLLPVIAWGCYPAQSEGNEVIVYDPATCVGLPEARRELARFRFPRQPEGERLCLADYFASVASGRLDVAVFQVVTVGDRVTALCDQLNQQGDYSRAYYVHGLSVSLAEALAEYHNRTVRRVLGLSGEQGRRYSWGYPACPDLEDHEKLLRLLPLDEIGVHLTSAHQLVPEQSTAAIVIHHPQAKYFSIGSTLERANQDVSSVAVSRQGA